ncbi:glycosyltransferase [Halomonas sp. NO4]|uniref:glycosyltransferase n=1 Tax=Halomonas sp. NO4 TaxID=2484813 RepID=UPI001969FE14|nr:glycosyltransferase [Halomonas sp. NO4]
MKVKYIYFFRGSLKEHVGLYKAWVDAVSDSVNINMTTFMTTRNYNEQKSLVDKYTNQGVDVFHANAFFLKLCIPAYFLFLALRYDGVVVHVRKQNTNMLNFIKKITKGKLRYIIDIEGDVESELKYLERPEKNLYDGFYNKEVKHLRAAAKANGDMISKADAVIVPTEKMKEVYLNRYSGILRDKISALPTAFSGNKFYYDEALRAKTRKKLCLEGKTVVVFCGALHYSWQNIKRSIEVFNKLSQHGTYNDLYFYILTRPQDYAIAENFMARLNVDSRCYTLDSVPHEDVNAVLNASDIGILLREDDLLNKVVSTGKLGEYLAAGLPVITTKHIGFYSRYLENKKFAYLFDDIFSDDELDKLIKKRDLLLSGDQRYKLSKWATDKFSVESQRMAYLDVLKKVERSFQRAVNT